MVNASYLKDLEINHLFMEIKEKVIKHDNLQLLLLLILRRNCISAEMEAKLQWIY